MTDFDAEHFLKTIEIDDVSCDVSVRITYDGLEHIGRLWFGGDAVGGSPIRDHGTIVGRTADEVIELAKRFTDDDLLRRWFRARAEKRKYLKLRKATDTILEKVKHLNRIAVSVKAGMLDPHSAQLEMDLVVRQLHEIVDYLPTVAGVEENS